MPWREGARRLQPLRRDSPRSSWPPWPRKRVGIGVAGDVRDIRPDRGQEIGAGAVGAALIDGVAGGALAEAGLAGAEIGGLQARGDRRLGFRAAVAAFLDHAGDRIAHRLRTLGLEILARDQAGPEQHDAAAEHPARNRVEAIVHAVKNLRRCAAGAAEPKDEWRPFMQAGLAPQAGPWPAGFARFPRSPCSEPATRASCAGLGRRHLCPLSSLSTVGIRLVRLSFRDSFLTWPRRSTGNGGKPSQPQPERRGPLVPPGNEAAERRPGG